VKWCCRPGIGLDLAWDKTVVPKRGDAHRTLECNLYGLESCCRLFLSLIQPGGAIVNISSGAAGMNMFRMSEEKRAWMLREDLTWEELRQAAAEFSAVFDEHVEVSEMPRLAESGWWLQVLVAEEPPSFLKAAAATPVLSRAAGI